MIGETISGVCGWPSYVEEYAAHRHELAARGVESSPGATALLEYMRATVNYNGPVGGLATELVRRRTGLHDRTPSEQPFGDDSRPICGG